MSDVFVSYSREDSEHALRLTEALKARGIDVFLDSESLVAGESWAPKVNRAIESSDAVAVFLSHNSKRSKWVEKELVYALEKEKHVIPILLDGEGKQNWVWPLVADRKVWRLDENSNFSELADRIQEAIVVQTDSETEKIAMSEFRAFPRWKPLLLSIISAILGGLIVWLLLRFQ